MNNFKNQMFRKFEIWEVKIFELIKLFKLVTTVIILSATGIVLAWNMVTNSDITVQHISGLRAYHSNNRANCSTVYLDYYGNYMYIPSQWDMISIFATTVQNVTCLFVSMLTTLLLVTQFTLITTVIIMRSLHEVHEGNALWVVHVCPHISIRNAQNE